MNNTDILREILHTLHQIRDRLPEPRQQPSPQQQPETAGRNPDNPARLRVLAILGGSQSSAPIPSAESDVKGSSPKRSV